VHSRSEISGGLEEFPDLRFCDLRNFSGHYLHL
jgi:hypothetical protein